MVVFTCNNCGDSLQKPKVEKHYLTTCRRNPISVSCMDCFKDFRGQEYVEHIKCISEAQRYSGKDYTPKPGQNRGEKKQLAWCDMVRSVIENNKNINPKQRFVLNHLKQITNVPRKKTKFMNFMDNSYHGQKDADTIESVWNILEAVLNEQRAQDLKTASDNSVKKNEKPAQNGNQKSEAEEVTVDKSVKENKQSEQNGNHTTPEANNSDATLSKKERKEKRRREKYETELKEVKNSAPDLIENDNKDKPSKKKRKIQSEGENSENILKEVKNSAPVNAPDLIENDNEDKPSKKKRKIQSEGENNEDIENIKSNNEKKGTSSEEASNEEVSTEINGNEDKGSKKKFDWSKVIIDVLESKNNELSIKKLKKKVLTQYKSFNEIEDCSEEIIAKFNKKLNKIKSVKLDEDKAILVKE